MKSTFAMLGLLLLLCGGAFWLLGFEPGQNEGRTVPEGRPDPSPVVPAEAGTGPEEAAPELSPDVEQISGFFGLLASDSLSSRLRAVVGLSRAGAAAREAVPLLEEIIRTETGSIRFQAMTAVMRIEGSRRYYRELAECAALPSNRGRGPAYNIFRGFDRANAAAILVAIHLRDRGTGKDAPPPGLSAFLDRFFEDEAAGLRELSERVAGATTAELDPWFRVVRMMKPMPAALAPALQRQLQEGDDGDRKRVLGLLASTRNDATALRESMAPFVRAQVAEADPEYRSALLSTLGNLGADDPASIEVLRNGLATGSVVADGAVRSLARLGVKARPAIDELIRSAEAREPGTRPWHINALLATEDQRAIPFLAKVLSNGYYAEVNAILSKAPAMDGADGLAPAFLELFPRVPRSKIYQLLAAALRCDPMMSRDETESLLVRALDDERPPCRRNALACIPNLEAITDGAARALARAFDPGPDKTNVTGFRRAIEACPKLGEDVRPVVPSLLRHVGDIRLQWYVLKALVAIAPEEDGCLDVFRRYAVEGRTSQVRAICVNGIGEIDVPTKTDVALLEKLAAAKADRYQSSGKAATEILNRPEWKKLRAE